MNLFHVRRPDEGGYDTFDSFIVAADDEVAARLVHPYGEGYAWNESKGRWEWRINNRECGDDTWADPKTLIVKHIGTAVDGISGVICASFNAA